MERNTESDPPSCRLRAKNKRSGVTEDLSLKREIPHMDKMHNRATEAKFILPLCSERLSRSFVQSRHLEFCNRLNPPE
jgi:hypothetical protein